MRLRDVGRVQLGGESYAVSATDLQGVPSVGLAVYQLTGSNALEVSDGVKKVLAEFEKTMPIGMKMEKIYDNTDFITASIKGVVNSLRDAVILVVLILFLFLQNWKATLVPGIAIPVALIGTFGLVLAFGFSLNQLTLFGLVLATGLVVDDAITVIEDTSTKKSEGLSALEAAKSTMDELFSAIIATSLVKFAVFLPVLFFPGATGTIYKQFAATVIFSIAISTFNALTFSPMLSALLLARESKDPGRKVYAIAGTVIGFIYGLLVVGDGAALVLVPTIAGALVGLLLTRFLHRPAVLPFTVGGAIAGLVLVGVSRILPVMFYPASRSHAGLVHPSDLQQLQSLLCGDGNPLFLCSELGPGITPACDGNSRRRHSPHRCRVPSDPGGFVPIEDQGYAIGFVQAPEGVSTQVTEAINEKVASVLRTEKDITAASVFSGASLDGNSPNKGLFFFGTKTGLIVRKETRTWAPSWSDSIRNWPLRLMVPGCLSWSLRPFLAMEPEVDLSFSYSIKVVAPTAWLTSMPPLDAWFRLATPILISTGSTPSLPLSHPKSRSRLTVIEWPAVGVDFGSAMQTFSVNFGGLYVNDTFQEGKVRRVYVQADAESRAHTRKSSHRST